MNRLETKYGSQITFVYLDARDAGQGESAFEALSLLGHPGFVIFDADGKEVFRLVGQVEEQILSTAIDNVVSN